MVMDYAWTPFDRTDHDTVRASLTTVLSAINRMQVQRIEAV